MNIEYLLELIQQRARQTGTTTTLARLAHDRDFLYIVQNESEKKRVIRKHFPDKSYLVRTLNKNDLLGSVENVVIDPFVMTLALDLLYVENKQQKGDVCTHCKLYTFNFVKEELKDIEIWDGKPVVMIRCLRCGRVRHMSMETYSKKRYGI